MKKLLSLITLLPCFLWAQPRQIQEITHWTCYPAYDVSREPEVEQVTVPHTWNLEDVFGGMDYKRTSFVYECQLPAIDEGRRAFLHFDGVNSFAEVAVNQQYATHHAGGYTAFATEITPLLKEEDNKLTVVASNAYRTDVAPLAGDFNIYGGITRPVHLIMTGPDCISPLDYGSCGVYVHQDKIIPQQADVTVETLLSLTSNEKDRLLRVTFVDADGNNVAQGEQQLSENGDTSCRVALKIKNPHLWNGRQDPYLYKVRVELLTNGTVVDSVEETTGLRSFHVDSEEGFFLNGRHLDLYGVCRHEEGYKTGGLYNEVAMRQDADIINELGCTAVRFVHYPHSRYDVRMYDERGIVVWQELNLAGPGGYNSPGYVKNPQLEANVMQNLIEMVKQHYNSPSICFWSLCNELSFKYDEPATFLRQLHEKAKQLDPQRLTTLAICYDQDRFQGITDVIGWNKYFGYYENSKGGVGAFMDKAHQEAGLQPIGLCEYGAAGSHLQHSFEARVTNRIHYEENQARVHEENWQDMATRPYAWCKFIWQYADNPSSIRDEGDQRGMNDKGIVSYDRTVRKDAYYFYKANWSSEPMLYIAARRYTQRTEAVTDVKVYTNQPSATLYLNGRKVGKAKKDNLGRIVFHDVTLCEGDNTILVKSRHLTDECHCTFTTTTLKSSQTITEETLNGSIE